MLMVVVVVMVLVPVLVMISDAGIDVAVLAIRMVATNVAEYVHRSSFFERAHHGMEPRPALILPSNLLN